MDNDRLPDKGQIIFGKSTKFRFSVILSSIHCVMLRCLIGVYYSSVPVLHTGHRRLFVCVDYILCGTRCIAWRARSKDQSEIGLNEHCLPSCVYVFIYYHVTGPNLYKSWGSRTRVNVPTVSFWSFYFLSNISFGVINDVWHKCFHVSKCLTIIYWSVQKSVTVVCGG